MEHTLNFLAIEMAKILKEVIQKDMSSKNPTGIADRKFREHTGGSQTLSEMVDEIYLYHM